MVRARGGGFFAHARGARSRRTCTRKQQPELVQTRLSCPSATATRLLGAVASARDPLPQGSRSLSRCR